MRRWRFRSLPLRSRLALMTAAAVAAAVAAVAVAAWFLTRDQLMRQLDGSLQARVRPGNAKPVVLNLLQHCSSDGQAAPAPGPPIGLASYVQLINPDGTVLCLGQGSKTIAVQSYDKQIAAGQGGDPRPHDGRTTDGEAVRVFTQQVVIRETGQTMGLTVARPLDQVTNPLDRLALIMAIVAGVGVAVATTAGLGIASAGLKPVDRLTDAVEHIARTEDLAIRIPVEGEDEIARLSASFNSMTAQLATSRERQQQLIADAGHELRTPLTSLRTNIELLARSEETGRPLPPEDRKALLSSVTAQMTELALLIGDLQELARPDAVPGSGPVQLVALHEVTENALRRARLRGPDLLIDARLSPWYVRAEPAALERAVVNLLDNAVKFSPPEGRVEVALRGGELTVRDHGPGIPPEELPHVFERFWRSPSARSLPGSGLGLSIVARTIQNLGGAVALQPAPGGGTVARVRLPGSPNEPGA